MQEALHYQIPGIFVGTWQTANGLTLDRLLSLNRTSHFAYRKDVAFVSPSTHTGKVAFDPLPKLYKVTAS